MNPNSARAHLLLADTLQQLGAVQSAYQLIQKALTINPTSGPGHCMLGFVRLDLGDFGLAISAFEHSISLLPVQGDAYLGLVTSKKVREADRPLVEQMVATLQDPELTRPDRAQVHAALGKAFDDLEEYALAISHVEEGNKITLSLDGSARPAGSKEAIAAEVARTIKTFTLDFYGRHHGFGITTEAPIFIVGLPRSGTTLTEQVLSSHSQVSAGGEIRYWEDIGSRTPDRLFGLAGNRQAAKAAAEEYLRLVRHTAPNAKFITDKYNDNFFNLGFLHLVFPNSRVIHCKRNPVDNCLSLFVTPFRRKNPLFCSREAILEYYDLYCRLMAHWREVLPSSRFLEVDYEDMVENHEEVTRRVIDFCGLEWEDSCLKHEDNKRVVNTPSKWQARQPIYKTSVERWKRYEPWLGAFQELLAKDANTSSGKHAL